MVDLSNAFVTAPSPTMRYGMGRILAWDSATFENVIEWQGERIENLSVVGTTDALAYQPGQIVALYGMDADGSQGTTQWWIAGRLFTPGSDNAEEIVSFLRGSLAREIAAEAFASQIHPDFDAAVAQRTSDTWGDPTNGADPGPLVSGVEIVTGTALIMVTCNIEFSTSNSAATGTPRVAGLVGVEVSGASSVAPDDNRAIFAQSFKSRSGGSITTVDGVTNVSCASMIYPVTGLNAGTHTFTVKYRKPGSTTDYVNVDDRSLAVIAL